MGNVAKPLTLGLMTMLAYACAFCVLGCDDVRTREYNEKMARQRTEHQSKLDTLVGKRVVTVRPSERSVDILTEGNLLVTLECDSQYATMSAPCPDTLTGHKIVMARLNEQSVDLVTEDSKIYTISAQGRRYVKILVR